MPVVLHQKESKKSRDFVAAVPGDWIVLEYPDCVVAHPQIQGYPTVVVEVPAYHDTATSRDVSTHNETIFNPASVEHVRALIASYEQRAAEYPPRGGE